MGYLTRQPTSNEPAPQGWPYGPDGAMMDDFATILGGFGARCDGCNRVTLNRFLDQGCCPPCLAHRREVKAADLESG